ncbi:hypothetical protein [Candidatus Xianfuyuplasma coldseepsis]|uniref:Lipoprotein n=1 Tax=Candidatus Xianfuyuplasma coldseepsis TaxID=2782163 RepID=A0A7L7KQP3_9MOLU|nr:hypothetical protein [Xianfuyuplasma coldseepsis]QMS85131.1 hypothetical protein G4Z02_05025 [Xianfuyuplasma coldseepsis]
MKKILVIVLLGFLSTLSACKGTDFVEMEGFIDETEDSYEDVMTELDEYFEAFGDFEDATYEPISFQELNVEYNKDDFITQYNNSSKYHPNRMLVYRTIRSGIYWFKAETQNIEDMKESKYYSISSERATNDFFFRKGDEGILFGAYTVSERGSIAQLFHLYTENNVRYADCVGRFILTGEGDDVLRRYHLSDTGEYFYEEINYHNDNVTIYEHYNASTGYFMNYVNNYFSNTYSYDMYDPVEEYAFSGSIPKDTNIPEDYHLEFYDNDNLVIHVEDYRHYNPEYLHIKHNIKYIDGWESVELENIIQLYKDEVVVDEFAEGLFSFQNDVFSSTNAHEHGITEEVWSLSDSSLSFSFLAYADYTDLIASINNDMLQTLDDSMSDFNFDTDFYLTWNPSYFE